ncbi:MAG: ABC transporter permease [Vicinamibacterales bacterium]
MLRRFLKRRTPSGDAIGEELKTHIAQRAADIAARGVPLDDALDQARAQFGAVEHYEQQCRREQRLGAISHFATGLSRDFVYAWRRLRATPLFTIFAVVSLAVGVGVTTAVFSVVRATLWKPPGVSNPGRIAFISGSAPFYGARPTWSSIVSGADFEDLASAQQSFSQIAASATATHGLGDDTRAQIALIEGVTGSYFSVFGVHPIAGRVLDAADNAAQAPVVVVSAAFWRTRLGSDSAAVGRTVRIAERAFQVVGIAHESFDGIWLHPSRQTSAWIPMRTLTELAGGAEQGEVERRTRRHLWVVGRLAHGVSAPQASAEITTLGRQLDTAFPLQLRSSQGIMMPGARNWTARTVSEVHAEMSAGATRFGLLITLLVGMVLIVACTNLANLMLARGAARAVERAVRQALGASRGRLVREYAAEAVILAALGAVGAFVVTRGLLYSLTMEVPIGRGQILQLAPRLSVEALAVAVGAVLLSLLVFGIGPALQLTRRSPRSALAGAAGSVGSRQQRSQGRLIRWQVAIASTFFIIATLFMKSVLMEARHDSGIDLGRMAVAVLDFQLQRWDEGRARYATERIAAKAAEHPAIERVAISSGLPYGTSGTPYAHVTRGNDTFVKGRIYPDARTLAATPEIFPTIGVPIIRGRAFDGRDVAGAQRVAVLSEKTARDVFGTVDVVGREITFRLPRTISGAPAPDPVRAAVIGIARDTDVSSLTRRGSSGLMYLPLAQQYFPSLTIVGRARTDADHAAGALRTAVAQAAPGLAISQSGSGRSVLAGFYYFARIVASGIGGLGLLALLLSMAGLYGVLTQAVTMRTREVGLRMALGAEKRSISRMILGEGFRPIVQGLALGLFFGFAGRGIIRATLDANLPVFDPAMILFVPIPVVIAGFLACYLPARRAAEVDPNVALRAL